MAAARERAVDAVPGLQTTDDPLEALEGADAAALVTEWPAFRALDWPAVAGRMRRPIVVDGRNALDPEAMVAAGLHYAGFGRGFSGAAPPSVRPSPKVAARPLPATAHQESADAGATSLEMAGHRGR